MFDFLDHQQLFSDYLVPIVISLIMFGIGLGTELGEFKKELWQPKALFVGLFCQMLLLPVIAFAIVFIFPLSPTLQVGLILLAACPGGTASNLVTFLLKGRVALSIALTTINSFLIVFTIPLFVNLGLNLFMREEAEIHLPFFNTFLEVLLRILLPVALGILANRKFPNTMERIKKYLDYILPTLLFIVFAGVIFIDSGEDTVPLRLEFWSMLLPAFSLNIASILLSFYLSRKLGIRKKGAFTIGIEAGLQNSALAIFVAVSLLENKDLATIAVLYSAFSFFTTFLIGYGLKKFT